MPGRAGTRGVEWRWRVSCVLPLAKNGSESASRRLFVQVDTVRIYEKGDLIIRHRPPDHSATFHAARGIAGAPTRAVGCRQQRCLEARPLAGGEAPRIPVPQQRHVGGIIAAPDERAVAGVVVQETLVPESRVVGIRLVEQIVVAACSTRDAHAHVTLTQWLNDSASATQTTTLIFTRRISVRM